MHADLPAETLSCFIDASAKGKRIYLILKIADTDISCDKDCDESGSDALSHHFYF